MPFEKTVDHCGHRIWIFEHRGVGAFRDQSKLAVLSCAMQHFAHELAWSKRIFFTRYDQQRHGQVREQVVC